MKTHPTFSHLTASHRDRIHALYGQGHTQKAIAGVLGVHPGTICRELKRYNPTTWRYNADRAQRDAEEKRTHSKCPGMKVADNPVLKQYIIQQLKYLRSPDEIAGRMKRDKVVPRVGKNAIYKWLYSEDGAHYCRYLCTRRSKKKTQHRLGKRILIPNRISLRDRPNQEGLIHAEGDLFVSPTRLRSKTCGLLVVDPTSKLLTGVLIPNKTTRAVVPVMKKITTGRHMDTCTFDNGIENIHHAEFGVPAYFCEKGSPWQKPHIESSIGLVRRWFLPKGTNLALLDQATFQSQLHLLNSKYRKSLNYQSAYEVGVARGIIECVPRISLSKAIAMR